MEKLLLVSIMLSYVYEVSGSCGLSFYITGPPSEIKDDAQSRAICPAGLYVTECYCEDSRNCDGSQWLDERTCAAYNKGRAKEATVAVARCQPAAFLDVKAIKLSLEEGEPLKCPNSYIMEGCSRVDWWSPSRITEVIRRLNVNSGEVECAWHLLNEPATGSNKKLPVSAICVKDACPDCKDVFEAMSGGSK